MRGRKITKADVWEGRQVDVSYQRGARGATGPVAGILKDEAQWNRRSGTKDTGNRYMYM